MTTPQKQLAVSNQLTAKSEAEIVMETLDGRSPASVDTLKWFNERIPKKLKLKNRQSIHDWTIEKYNPSHMYLNTLVIFYAEGDPRRMMAEQILEMRRNAIRAHWVGEVKS